MISEKLQVMIKNRFDSKCSKKIRILEKNLQFFCWRHQKQWRHKTVDD